MSTKFGNLNIGKDKDNSFTLLSSVDEKPLLLNNNIQVGVVNAAGNTNAGISIKDRNDGIMKDIFIESSTIKLKDSSTTTSLIREDELSTVVNNSGDPLIFSNVHIDMKDGNGGLLNFFNSTINTNSNAITSPVGIRRHPTLGTIQFRNESEDWINIPSSSFQVNLTSPQNGQMLIYESSNSLFKNENFTILRDTNPELGGNLNTNSKHIKFADNYGFIDSSDNKLLIFDDTNSSANFELLISKTLGGPKIAANGTDSNIDLDIHAKGDGDINIVVNGGSTIITKPQINDISSNHQYIFGVSELATDCTVTLPLLTGNDEFVFKDHAVTLTNKTLTSPVISTISNTGTLTLPTSTDTLVGRATTDTLTNKTLENAVLNGTISGTAIKDEDNMSSNSSNHLATQQSIKAYVDARVQGLDIKESVRVATTENITLSNTQTIDTVSVVAGDRVLVKDQSTGSENGIYLCVDGGSWTRATDFDNDSEVTSGLFTFVEEGNTNANIGFVLTTTGTITVGTTALTFSQFSGAGSITVSAPISKNGNVLNLSGTLSQFNTALSDGSFCSLTGSETLTNKTLTSSTINNPVLTEPQINDTSSNHQYIFAVSELAADRTVTLPLLTGPDEFVFKDHTQTLTGKTLTSPIINSPVITTPQINDASSDHQYIFAVSELAADRTVTLPILSGNDEFVFKDHTQTLTNKSFDFLSFTKGIAIEFSASSITSTPTTKDLDFTANANFHISITGTGPWAVTFSATTSANVVGQTGQIIVENKTTNPSTISWTTSHGWYFESDSSGSIIVPTLTGTTNAIDVFNYTILVHNSTPSSRNILVTRAAHFQAH